MKLILTNAIWSVWYCVRMEINTGSAFPQGHVRCPVTTGNPPTKNKLIGPMLDFFHRCLILEQQSTVWIINHLWWLCGVEEGGGGPSKACVLVQALSRRSDVTHCICRGNDMYCDRGQAFYGMYRVKLNCKPCQESCDCPLSCIILTWYSNCFFVCLFVFSNLDIMLQDRLCLWTQTV